MEYYQSRQKVTVLNSKLDFVQPMRTHLSVISINTNKTPSIPDNQPATALTDRQPPVRPIRQPRQTRNKLEGKRRLADPNMLCLNPRQASTPTKPPGLPYILNCSPLKMSQLSDCLKDCQWTDEDTFDSIESDRQTIINQP